MTTTLARPSALDSAGSGHAAVPRDRWKRPLIQVPGTPELVPYTRCTTYVDCIEDKSALAAWGRRMVLLGAATAAAVVDEARSLHPEQDKKRLNALADQLVARAGAHRKREKGTAHHALTEYVDRGDALPACTAADAADMAAYKLATIAFDVVHVERLVVVDELRAAGTPDRILHYDGPGPDGKPFTGHLIGDLKTGSLDYGALKMAMQLAVYSRGQFYDPATGERTPLPDVNQDWGLIIGLEPGSARCDLYWVDLATGWQAVEVATVVRELRSKRHVLTPLAGAALPLRHAA